MYKVTRGRRPALCGRAPTVTSTSAPRPLDITTNTTRHLSQPNEPAALVLPRAHRLCSRQNPPEKLETIGDHLLRHRLVLKLLQRQVAEQIGADVCSLRNWEANRTKPAVEFMPAVIRFLGYNPLPPGTTWAERLVSGRKALGISQKESARRLGVDQSTMARWERGEREPAGNLALKARKFLSATELLPTIMTA
jgi:transcriptional regulator with XRE-family HTH domain